MVGGQFSGSNPPWDSSQAYPTSNSLRGAETRSKNRPFEVIMTSPRMNLCAIKRLPGLVGLLLDGGVNCAWTIRGKRATTAIARKNAFMRMVYLLEVSER